MIQLTRGFEASVDDADFEPLNKFKWSAHYTPKRRTVYAYRKSNGKSIYMHRFILDPQAGKEVDHIDRNGLNNVRSNLRLASKYQNRANSAKQESRSGLKGVSENVTPAGTKYFRARITHRGKTRNIGVFRTPKRAAVAYDKEALKIHGEYAATNKKLGLV